MTTPLWSLTATELAPMIRDGIVSAGEAVQSTLGRINSVNPALNAVVQRMDEAALRQADQIDASRRQGADLGAMAGVPVTVKVNIDQAGQATTNGLKTQAHLISTEDSPVVANLRRAGAIIVGRTNTPAFSLRWFTRNSLHGATLNPHDKGLTPGGSSGGAGAAVAAGIGSIGHGTDIAGSIRYPAYACGVHGLRPSLGRVPAFNPTAGDRLIGGQLMAVSGPMARSIPDLRLALAAMSFPDPRDPWYQAMPQAGPPAARRVAFLEAPDGMPVSAPVRQALRDAADRLSDSGYQIETIPVPPLREAMMLQLHLWMADFRHNGLTALRAENDPDASYVYDQLNRHAPEADLHGLMTTLQSRARLTREWRVFLASCPLVLCPVSGELPFADQHDVKSEVDFDRVLEAQLPMIATPFMGLPGVTVTTGFVGTSPVGVQLVADHYREDLLLGAAEVLAPLPMATTA